MSSQPNICPSFVLRLCQKSTKNWGTKLSHKLDLPIFAFGIWSHCSWTKVGQYVDMIKSNICPLFVLSLQSPTARPFLMIKSNICPLFVLSLQSPTARPFLAQWCKLWTIVGQFLDIVLTPIIRVMRQLTCPSTTGLVERVKRWNPYYNFPVSGHLKINWFDWTSWIFVFAVIRLFCLNAVK